MARIRSIKPEFPQSETIGGLSRDARLLFVLLWTIADDDGRARAASRMLASLLFPYDDDAAGLMEGWLSELERADCIVRYEVEKSRYLQIINWQKHQKIDRPSPSRLPAFEESSRIIASPRAVLDADLGPRIMDLGEDQDLLSSTSDDDIPAVDDQKRVKRQKPDDEDLIQDIAEIWNSSAASMSLAQISKLPPQRVSALRARLKEFRDFGFDDPRQGFSALITKIRGSPFLMGREGAWKADFDFAVSPKGFTKIMEGAYEAQERKYAGR